ncbi:MAG: 6-chlorohydroxyquinol-1,2-dioxygenase [Candidatus Eremiobacteraeota bacterium]|nr:6-chlorohydroxyquinol-1,2-dioxygenase [Candidatus Eremiobacteraeota bacterium]
MSQQPEIGRTLTNDVIASGANARDERWREIYAKLVEHLHAFVRDVELTPNEWLEGIRFLTATGQKCDDVRQEFILLSDTLGVSMLVDALANRAASAGTASTVLGPFFTTDAEEIPFGGSISRPDDGIPMAVTGTVRAPDGTPITNAAIEVWEVDGAGQYDVQYADRVEPNGRGRVRTDAGGRFSFMANLPVSYSIPGDGPVGAMLASLGRHTMRPAHLHFSFTAPGFTPLTTALYVGDDPYIGGDAVFGVKPSLIGDYVRSGTGADATASLHYDFVLVPERTVARV